MLMNYHEMTMGQPRNSSSNRRQYLIICVVMAAAFAWSVLQAGGLAPVEIQTSRFAGGTLVYKYAMRDYAAAQSLAHQVAKDAGIRVRNETYDAIFSLYLDDPNLMGGRRQRFAGGLLDSHANNGKAVKDIAEKQAALMQTNVGRVPPTRRELQEDGAFKLWPKLPYEKVNLPACQALVVQFPFTNGFVSAIVFGYKVLPAMRQAAVQAGTHAPVVLSTCSEKEAMCTHYAPLGQESVAFLLGQPDTDTYLASLGPEPSSLDLLAALRKMQRRVSTWFGGWFGLIKLDDDDDGNNDRNDNVKQEL